MLENAQLVHSEEAVAEAIDAIAKGLNEKFKDQEVLICPLMEGALVFAGKLLTKLEFPVKIQALKASRYQASKGSVISIKGELPPFGGAHVLFLDEILDEGITLDHVRDLAARHTPKPLSITTAVLVEKRLNKPKPIQADFVGLYVEEKQWVVGEGMDFNGLGRNYKGVWDIKCSE